MLACGRGSSDLTQAEHYGGSVKDTCPPRIRISIMTCANRADNVCPTDDIRYSLQTEPK